MAPGHNFDHRQFWLLLALLPLIYLLWDHAVLFPVKILVVFFHELGHAMAAVASGGRVLDIQLNAAQGGLTRTVGGAPFLILSAGYLGSVLAGCVLLLGAARTRRDDILAMALGIMLLVVGMLWVRPWFGFGFVYCLAAGVALLLSGRYLPPWVNDGLVKAIGLISCVYAVWDMKSDLLQRSVAGSDAAQLAQLTHIPALLWALIWMGLGIGAGVYCLYRACRR